jgi:formylglycine-generating enzyme required for sulfatase activity
MLNLRTKKTWFFGWIASFAMAANVHSAPLFDVGLVGPKGEVTLIYRDSDVIVYKECKDHTPLTTRADCVLKTGTSIQRVQVTDFKNRLIGLISIDSLTQEKASIEEEIAQIDRFIKSPNGGAANADTEKLKKLEADLERVRGLLSRQSDYKEAIEELVEEVISNQNLTPIQFSNKALAFEFYILRALRGECSPTGSTCPGQGSSCTKPDSTLCANFVTIKAGTFLMGSPEGERDRYGDEKQHQVTLTKNFEIQTTEVTQAQWVKVMGNNPSRFKNRENCYTSYTEINGVALCPNNPVEQVSGNDIQGFLSKLNGCTQNTCQGSVKYTYRLPTEAEWEYAARGGQYANNRPNDPCGGSSTSAYSFGNNPCALDDYAWYKENSGNQTQAVATKEANPAGLYDVHGNVWEWVQDGDGEYGNCSTVVPFSFGSGSYRVFRGGSWYNVAPLLRSASRSYVLPGYRYSNVGFRLVRTAQ